MRKPNGDYAKFQFTPKDAAVVGDWTVSLQTSPEGNGFDVCLFLDTVPATHDSGWMLELSIEPGGRVAGQISPLPGFDALAVFDCSPSQLRIIGNDPARNTIHIIGELEPGDDPQATQAKIDLSQIG